MRTAPSTITTTNAVRGSLAQLADQLDFVGEASEGEMRSMLVALTTMDPELMAALIKGVVQARRDRDIDAVCRAVDERRQS